MTGCSRSRSVDRGVHRLVPPAQGVVGEHGDRDRLLGDPPVEHRLDQVVDRHPEHLHRRLLVLEGEVAAIAGAQAAGQEEDVTLGGDARRGPQREELPPLGGLAARPPRAAPASPSSSGSSPSASRRPAGSSRNVPRAGWRYCRTQATRSSSSTASTITAPGCSKTHRSKAGPSGSSGTADAVLPAGPRSSRRGRGPRRPRPATTRTRRVAGRSCSDATVTHVTDDRGRTTQPDQRRGRGALRPHRRRAVRRRGRPPRPVRGRGARGDLDGRPSAATEPGASTFVDCTGEITHATLNGSTSTRPRRRVDGCRCPTCGPTTSSW